MEAMAEKLRTDVDELRAFLTSSKSERNSAFLTSQISVYEAELEELSLSTPVETLPLPVVADKEVAATVNVDSKPVVADPPPPQKTLQYSTIGSFGWDQGDYNSDTVCIYITSGIDGVEKVKKEVSCDFTDNSFDLKVHGLNGKNYRLIKDNLDKDIVAAGSKVIVKKKPNHHQAEKGQGRIWV